MDTLQIILGVFGGTVMAGLLLGSLYLMAVSPPRDPVPTYAVVTFFAIVMLALGLVLMA